VKKPPHEWTLGEIVLACAITWALGFAVANAVLAWMYL
jgi:hypothetical protein